MLKRFFLLYAVFLLALLLVSAFQIIGDNEIESPRQALQNIWERIGIFLILILGVPAVLASLAMVFQSLLAKFKSK